MGVDLARFGREIRQPGHVVPVVGLQEVFDRVLGPHLGDGTARPIDLERDGATRRPAAGPQTGEIAPVVRVQVGEKDHVQVIKGDHQRRHVGVGAGADVENELVAVAELDQPAGRRLTATRRRHTGTEGDEADLVRPENLGARVVDVTVRCGLVRLRDRAACGLCRAGQPAASRQTVVHTPLIDADHGNRCDQSDSTRLRYAFHLSSPNANSLLKKIHRPTADSYTPFGRLCDNRQRIRAIVTALQRGWV